jgi:hypothetical protein
MTNATKEKGGVMKTPPSLGRSPREERAGKARLLLEENNAAGGGFAH